MERPLKRARLLSDESSSDESKKSETSSQENSQAHLPINEEYAKRFEHNKKREELHRLQEKYGDGPVKSLRKSGDNVDGGADADSSDSESDSESESEDTEGELVTTELDAEIAATLNAIKSKDPRVYDQKYTFYNDDGLHTQPAAVASKEKTKPLHLKDYHRRNLLEDGGAPEDTARPPLSRIEEETALKQTLLKQLHEARAEDDGGSTSDADDLLVAKPAQAARDNKPEARAEPDISTADKDPEKFLAEFLAARAWVRTPSSRLQPFESDDEDEDDRAEAFESAYNMRFEDPARANEKLTSHSREAAAKYSVRREESKGRKKAREDKKSQRDAARAEREEEKARLRRLKIEEAQMRLSQFKEAAGLKGDAVPIEEWSRFLDAGWESEKWDAEMARRFGDQYYDEDESEGKELEGSEHAQKDKRKPKKPKWTNDIDIGDIDPDFEKQEQAKRQTLKLSDDEVDDAGLGDEVNRSTRELEGSKKKLREQQRSEQKRQARKERQKIEELVDQGLLLNNPGLAGPSESGAGFRYRETSPLTFGLSAQDILMADDSQLNEYAGLKKLANFREPEKKAKDRKRLSKKARLRQWRKDTFGNENGPNQSLPDLIRARLSQADEGQSSTARFEDQQSRPRHRHKARK